MTKQIEALKLALEVMEEIPVEYDSHVELKNKAIVAVKEAIVTSDNSNSHQPVAWVGKNHLGERKLFAEKPTGKATPLYTAPPKREWAGLSADEIWGCNQATGGAAHICMAHQNILDFSEAIEARLKEKNHD